MDIGIVILRVVVGSLFAAHGAQKLFGWFGGFGLEGSAGFMGRLRYRNTRLTAMAAGRFETGAVLFLAAGLLTPLAAAAVVGVMINAIVSVKWPAGLFNGYEVDLLYVVAAATAAFSGAGAYSVDAIIGWQLNGATW